MESQAGRVESSSVYAQEGTNAHALAELNASLHFGLISEEGYSTRLEGWFKSTGVTGEDYEEMLRHVQDYVERLDGFQKEHPHTQVMLEQKVPTGVPSCWGTADTIMVSPEHVHVVDLKYGQGVPVSAESNSQLMLYGVGALDLYGDLLGTTEWVTVTVCQPRLGNTSSYSIAAQELRDWRDNTVVPIAKEALGPDAHFNPTEEACRWCPVAGECRPRLEKLTQEDFGQDPDLLTPAEIGEALARASEIRAWLTALEAAALDKAYSQSIPIPGWKVVMSRGNRKIVDPPAAIQNLIDNGYTPEQVAKLSIRGFGELDKLVGSKKLKTLLGDLIQQGEGRECLVPEADLRPSISPNTEAAKAFGNP
jgi:hypothetical protein